MFVCTFKKKIWKTFAHIKIAFVWWIKNSKVLSCSVFQSKCKFDVEMLAHFGFDWILFFKSVLDIEFGFCCHYFFFAIVFNHQFVVFNVIYLCLWFMEQVSSWNRTMCSGQSSSQPMPSLSPQKMPANGNEQRRYV